MKNRKLLLLGVVVSILSIGSFSSSDYLEGPFSVYNDFFKPSYIQVSQEGKGMQILSFPEGTEGYCGATKITLSEGLFIPFCDLRFDFYIPGYGTVEYYRVYDGNPSLLPGGVGALSGAISNLRNSVNEFTPIISYVGIGIISALLGFFAIRFLINWVRNNTLSVFKSRKRR